MGRLWQTALLTQFHPLFEYTPVESVVKKRQSDYYSALGQSDKEGASTAFVEFSLETIEEALNGLVQELNPAPLGADERLSIAQEKFSDRTFTRKDYIQSLKTISTATASRDLAFGVKKRLLEKSGDRALAVYRFLKT